MLQHFSKHFFPSSCQHCLCRSCAEECFDRRGTRFGLHGGRFKCPTCRYEVCLDRHGVYGLPRNLLVESIIDMMDSEKKNAEEKSQSKIKEEEERIKQEKLEEIKLDLEKQKKMCEKSGDPLNVYCLTCQKLICARASLKK